MNNAVFGKTMENKRKHRDTQLATAKRRRNYLASEPNHHITKFFTENLIAIQMKMTEILKNKPICFGLSILELCEILIYELWYDYVKPKYDEKSKLCYISKLSKLCYR